MVMSTAFLDFKLKGKSEAYAKGYRNPGEPNPYSNNTIEHAEFKAGQQWRNYDEDEMRAK